MAHALFDSPAPYLRSSQLPVGTSIISNGLTYGVDADRFLVETPYGINLPVYYALIDSEPPFSQGDEATLPNGLTYNRTGDVWLLAPIRVPKSVILTTPVDGHEGYYVIKQTSEVIGPGIDDVSVITFNVPVCLAKDNEFSGSDDEVFARSPDGKRKKITIALSLCLMGPLSGHLKSKKDQANTVMTKGRLAKAIAKVIEETLDLENNIVLAFADGKFLKEVTLDDLFLVDLVQKSKGTFQPTIALRI